MSLIGFGGKIRRGEVKIHSDQIEAAIYMLRYHPTVGRAVDVIKHLTLGGGITHRFACQSLEPTPVMREHTRQYWIPAGRAVIDHILVEGTVPWIEKRVRGQDQGRDQGRVPYVLPFHTYEQTTSYSLVHDAQNYRVFRPTEMLMNTARSVINSTTEEEDNIDTHLLQCERIDFGSQLPRISDPDPMVRVIDGFDANPDPITGELTSILTSLSADVERMLDHMEAHLISTVRRAMALPIALRETVSEEVEAGLRTAQFVTGDGAKSSMDLQYKR
jgi:hypothetical protein